VAAADGVLVLFAVVVEGLRVLRLDDAHALVVEPLNRVVDGTA
jgi:hypothetical protein